jgi:hypothetical protein
MKGTANKTPGQLENAVSLGATIKHQQVMKLFQFTVPHSKNIPPLWHWYKKFYYNRGGIT